MTELISTLVLFINETLLYWVPALVLLGYAVKHCTGFPNQLIPLVEVSGGALIGILIESCFTFTNEWHWLLVPLITVLFGGIGFVGYFFLSHHLEQKEAKEHLPQGLNDEAMR